MHKQTYFVTSQNSLCAYSEMTNGAICVKAK